MAETEIWRMSAAETASAVARNELSCEEVARASLDRIEATNPALNAVVDSQADAALDQARRLDMEPPENRGPLHGVPVTIKVNVDQIGRPTTNGVSAYSNVVAPDDAPVVRNLLRSGAVIVGRTNTPEFSFRADTDNPLHGRTHNPWGKHVSAGGSSGGAGVAVITGMCALAHGNDIGGSLRFPAAAVGAVSLKPGLGRVPAWNPSQRAERGLLAQLMSVQGLIARSANDLGLAMPSIVAPDSRDPFHVPLPWHGLASSELPKVGFTRETFGHDLHPEVSAALDAARDALIDAGYEIVEFQPPDLPECAETGFRALMGEIKALMGAEIETHGSEAIRNVFATYFRLFPPLEGDELLRAIARRSHYSRLWSIALQETPIVLTPFLPAPFFAPDRDLEGDAGVMDVLGCAVWSYSMNFMGLPAGCVPVRIAWLDRGPQPISVQVVGQRWREDLVVDACAAIESRTGAAFPTLWERMET